MPVLMELQDSHLADAIVTHNPFVSILLKILW